MRLEQQDGYVRVLVGPDDVFPCGKSLRYTTWIGTINTSAERHGEINVWTPAASVFRGYKASAREWLQRIAAELPKP
jgi:hypothetical protein